MAIVTFLGILCFLTRRRRGCSGGEMLVVVRLEYSVIGFIDGEF